MLNVLQKEYTLDVVEFARWQEEVFHRRTLFGKLSFYIGRIVALTFIVKLGLSTKNVVQPDYKTEMIDKITKFVIQLCHHLLGLGNKGTGPVDGTALAITIVIEYFILVCMAILIAFNV